MKQILEKLPSIGATGKTREMVIVVVSYYFINTFSSLKVLKKKKYVQEAKNFVEYVAVSKKKEKVKAIQAIIRKYLKLGYSRQFIIALLLRLYGGFLIFMFYWSITTHYRSDQIGEFYHQLVLISFIVLYLLIRYLLGMM